MRMRIFSRGPASCLVLASSPNVNPTWFDAKLWPNTSKAVFNEHAGAQSGGKNREV